MNMITFSARDRARIVALHSQIVEAIDQRDGTAASDGLQALETETLNLAQKVFETRSAKT